MNVSLFLETLPIMLKGMLGIFVVTGVLILLIVGLNFISARFFPDNGKKPQ